MNNKIPDIAFNKKSNKKLEFEIFPIQKLFSRKNILNHYLQKPHRIKFYNIIYITEGTGKHSVDFQDHKYGPGSLIFVSKKPSTFIYY